MPKSILKALLVVLLSGFAYYYGQGFHFQWWLMWLAPIPLLIYVYRANFWWSLAVSFLVGLAQGLNGAVGYYGMLPLASNLIGAAIQSIEWTIVVLIVRAIVRRNFSWASIFVYPAVFSFFEWLQSLGSDGIFNSIAPSQLPALPVMQVASLTGFIGVTFVISLFASTIAYIILSRQKVKSVCCAGMVGGLIILISLVYGFYHLHAIRVEAAPHVKVGLAAIEAAPRRSYDPALAEHFVQAYQPLIQQLAAQGATVVLLPEESFTVTAETRNEFVQQLGGIAQQNHITLIVGVNELGQKRFNAGWLFSPEGVFLGEYHKRHFVPVVEDGITPGVKLLNFPLNDLRAGIAICRDMDYTNPAHQYGENDTGILFVPAWDFDVDAFVHDQNALTDGIENGYTLVRNARSGVLSVTTASGEVLDEATNIDQKPTVLVVNAPISTHSSFYSQHPYWFVLLLGILFILLLGQALFARRKNSHRHL